MGDDCGAVINSALLSSSVEIFILGCLLLLISAGISVSWLTAIPLECVLVLILGFVSPLLSKLALRRLLVDNLVGEAG